MRLFVLLLLVLNLSPAWAHCAPGPVSEQRFVEAGGIRQWVTIEGADCANPVVFYVHGGPGNPLNPFGEAIFGAWRKHYTVVLWDQRGAGMTYGANPPGEDDPLTIAQLRDDGLAVAEQVAQHVGQRKLILMGSSWGSLLAVHMAQARPGLFHAYVGVSQLVDGRANIADAYSQVLALARTASDAEHQPRLEALGAPPWNNPRHFGVMRRAIRKYEAQATDAPPPHWWKPSAAYATPKALADAEAGEDYSFLQFVGLRGDGMLSKVDLFALGTTFKMPVYLVQGEHDLLTSAAVTRRYFDQLKAPRKELIVVPRAGHDPNQALVDAQFKVLQERVLPAL